MLVENFNKLLASAKIASSTLNGVVLGVQVSDVLQL